MKINTEDMKIATQQVAEGIPALINPLIRLCAEYRHDKVLGSWLPLIILAGTDVTGKLLLRAWFISCQQQMNVFKLLVNDLKDGVITKEMIEKVKEDELPSFYDKLRGVSYFVRT